MSRGSLFAFVLFFAPLTVLAAPASLVFTSSPQSVAVDAVSGQLSIQSQDGSAASALLPQTGCVLLKSTSPQGQFSSSASTWTPLVVLTMNKGTANKNFFYKDSLAGAQTLTATLVLKPEEETRSCSAWPAEEWGSGWSATQLLTVGSAAAEVSTPAIASATPAPAPSGGLASVPVITAAIAVAPRVVAGAGAVFDGSAFGAKGEPLLSGVRYLWNFGDGATAEGKRVLHTYAYPGPHVVILTIGYNYSSAQARTTVTALSPEIAFVVQADGSAVIANRSDEDLDLGLWGIQEHEYAFVIPEGTIVLPRGGVRFSPAVMGFAASAVSALRFPNGKEAMRATLSTDFPLRGERLAASQIPVLVHTNRTVSAQAITAADASVSAASEGEVYGAFDETEDEPKGLLWVSVAGLAVLLVVSIGGVLYLQHTQKGTETLPRAEEFEIE